MSGYDDEYKAMVARIRAQRANLAAGQVFAVEPVSVEPVPVEDANEESPPSSSFPFNVSLPKDSGGSGV